MTAPGYFIFSRGNFLKTTPDMHGDGAPACGSPPWNGFGERVVNFECAGRVLKMLKFPDGTVRITQFQELDTTNQ